MEMGLLTLDGLQSTPLAPRACSHLGRMSFHQKEPRAQLSSPHSTAALCAPLGMRIPGNSSSQSQHSPTLGKRGSHSQGVFWRHLPLDSCSPFSQRIFLQGAEGKPTRGVPAMQPELILSSTQSSGIPSHTQPSLPEPQQIFLGGNSSVLNLQKSTAQPNHSLLVSAAIPRWFLWNSCPQEWLNLMALRTNPQFLEK